MITLNRTEMEHLQSTLRYYLWRASHDGSLYWDNAAHHDGDTMVAGLSDAWDEEAESYPELFTFERTVE